MTNSRILNARRNLISTVVSRITGLILPFILRSVMLSTLGVEYLGLTGLFQSVFAFLNLAELGFGSAIVYMMYKPIAEGDTETVCSLLSAFRHCYRVSGAVILAAGLGIVPFLPHLIHGQTPEGIQLTVVYLVLLVDSCIGYFFFAYREALFTASQRTDILSYVGMGVRIVTAGLQIAALLLYRNYYLYCLVLPLLTAGRNLTIAVLSKRMYPQYECRGHLSTEQKRELRKQVSGLLIGNVSGRLTYELDSIVISAFIGLAALARFQNYNVISMQLTAFIGLLCASILPTVGNSMVTETKEKNYQDMNTYQFIYMWLNGWIVSCLVCLYQPFIQLWLGGEMLLPDSLLPIFGLYYMSSKMNDVCYQYRVAAGLWWEDRHRAVFAGLFNIIFDIVLVRRFGIAGVMLATILYQVFFDAVWGVRILFRHTFPDHSPRSYLRKIVFYMGITAVICGICWAGCMILPTVDGRGWPAIGALLLKAAACTLISNIIMWCFYHRMPEYRAASRIVKRLLSGEQEAEA